MANTFKLKTDTAVGTTLTTVYTVPASPATTTVIIGAVLSNITAGQVKANVQIVTASSTGENADDVYLVKLLPIPAGSSFELMEGKVVMETGDMFKVESDTASSLDVALSIMEQT